MNKAHLDIHSRMGDDAFDEKLLTEKLSKLNSSQQSIESLSRWCVSNRKKAKQVVETWEKLFKSAQREQQISFLYLANDILQNSRRKGSEFVNEFWKILPASLKSVYDLGHENCRKVASRLVNIWEERKVFGSRGQNLKNAIMGKTPPVAVSNVKNSNPIKVVKRDGNSLRIKLAVGGMPEKILTAFQLVHDEDVNEEAALKQCRTAVSFAQEMEKDVQNVSSQGNLQGSDLVDKIQEQENALQQCVRQLENAEAIRVALVSQLKEALVDQETKLALIQSELHVAQGLIEQAANMRQRLVPGFSVPTTANQLMEANALRMVEPKYPATQSTNYPPAPPPPPTHPLTPFSTSNLSEEESKKATVAAVAAKLAASTSSAQMLTSVLSSLVAEEAASMSSSLKSAGFPSLPILPPEKRQKLEKSTPFSDMDNSDAGDSAYFSKTQQVMANMPPNSMQSAAQTNRMQAAFLPPLPPPPPLAPPSNSPASQFVQSAMVGPPYGYGAGNLLPPSLSSNIAMGLARPGPPQQAQPQQLQNQQQQPPPPPPPNGGYYRPPGIGFYGQSHQPSTPPVPRQ